MSEDMVLEHEPAPLPRLLCGVSHGTLWKVVVVLVVVLVLEMVVRG